MIQDLIDLNADLGEGFGRWTLTDDEALLSVVTSANVACGFHAGDPAVMRRVCDLAAARGVRIGAQVSYRDLAGFGRRAMDVPADELAAEVAYQIGALRVFAEAAGAEVAYVKPHGALYNRTVHDAEQAGAVVAGVRLAGGSLPVLGLPGSRLLAAAADAGLTPVPEAFADRAYTPGARWYPGASRTPWSATRTRWCAAPWRSPSSAPWTRWTVRVSRSPPVPCACTATPRARPGSRSGCATRSKRPHVKVGAFA